MEEKGEVEKKEDGIPVEEVHWRDVIVSPEVWLYFYTPILLS